MTNTITLNNERKLFVPFEDFLGLQLHVAYERNSKGKLPLLALEPGCLVFREDSLYPVINRHSHVLKYSF